MRRRILAVLALAAAGAGAQTILSEINLPALPIPPDLAAIPPDKVVATVDGIKITGGELARYLSALTHLQENFRREPEAFLRTYGLMKRLAALAVKDGLQNLSPYQERLVYQRDLILMQAEIDAMGYRIIVKEEEQRTYYDANPDRFTEASVKVIYISFTDSPSPAGAGTSKALTEAQAKAKAEVVLKQIRAGASFVDMVRRHSDDPNSKPRDGDLGAIKRSDNLPEAVTKTIFALKKGEVSDVLGQPNGFYIFRVEDLKRQPFDQVRDDIYKHLKQTTFQKWLEGQRSGIEVKMDTEALGLGKPAQPAR